jgi:FKBP-type peptidyl-prolyl cis-trans isomerase
MKEGGKSTLLIPSELAYGTYGRYPYIQGYTPLLFAIELVKVKAGPGE